MTLEYSPGYERDQEAELHLHPIHPTKYEIIFVKDLRIPSFKAGEKIYVKRDGRKAWYRLMAKHGCFHIPPPFPMDAGPFDDDTRIDIWEAEPLSIPAEHEAV